jgi:hypothetical protein
MIEGFSNCDGAHDFSGRVSLRGLALSRTDPEAGGSLRSRM